MSKITEKDKITDYSRRNTLLLGATLFSACFTGYRAIASGGGGGLDVQIEYDDSDEDDDEAEKREIYYSQVRFGQLGQRKINTLYYQFEKKEINFGLDGFSKRMAPTILYMSYNNRLRARSLLRDMSRLKPETKRKSRLKLEVEYSVKMESDLKISARTLRKAKSPDLEKEKVRLKHAKGYKSGVKKWYRYPIEGTF